MESKYSNISSNLDHNKVTYRRKQIGLLKEKQLPSFMKEGNEKLKLKKNEQCKACKGKKSILTIYKKALTFVLQN